MFVSNESYETEAHRRVIISFRNGFALHQDKSRHFEKWETGFVGTTMRYRQSPSWEVGDEPSGRRLIIEGAIGFVDSITLCGHIFRSTGYQTQHVALLQPHFGRNKAALCYRVRKPEGRQRRIYPPRTFWRTCPSGNQVLISNSA
jgi:hypothetical protein